MPFPSDHVYPPDLRAWRLEGHQFAAGERIEVTEYEQGEDRHREIRSATFWPAAVSTVLVGDEFTRFNRWYENDLQGGSQLFDTQVASLAGDYAQWWQARFASPFTYQALNSGVYVINAELILLDGPYDENNLPEGSTPGDPPRVSPSVMGEVVSDSQATMTFGSSAVYGRAEGDSDAWLIVENPIYMRATGDSDVTMQVRAVSFFLLPDGVSYLLLPDGVSRLALPE
jgi:hypothetical protein